jgi:2-methylcitrate dehydratase PrpD
MKITQKLAEFVVNTNCNEIPEGVKAIAKRAILDTIGVVLAGSTEDSATILIDLAQDWSSSGKCSIIGHEVKTSPVMAALINGFQAHVLDYDDSCDWVTGHPSGCILPAALAAAQDSGVSGEQLLAAYVMGFEVEARIGATISPAHYESGWHATSTIGSLGAAVAAAKVRNLDVPQVQIALGVAASLASGIRRNFGTMTKPLHSGNAARNGVLAADLAKRGFSAYPDILESKYGFLDVFDRIEPSKLEQLQDTLGNPFALLNPGVRQKLYPSCSTTHRPIEAAIYLKRKENFPIREIEKVECGVIYRAPEILLYDQPKTGLEGKFSLEYCVARALMDGDVRLNHFTDQKVLQRDLRDLMGKISKYVHPDGKDRRALKREFAEVRVILRDGRSLEHRVYEQRGHPKNPLSDEELLAKYGDCAKQVLSKADVESSIEQILNLESLAHVGQLRRL